MPERKTSSYQKLLGRGLKASFLLVVLGLAVVVWPGQAQAHEKWFVKDPNSFPLKWERIFDWPVLVAVLVAAVATGTALFIDKQYRVWRRAKNPNLTNRLIGVEERRLRRLYAWLPLILAIHTAIPLLVNGIQLQLFAPNLKLDANLFTGLLALAEVVIALSYIYGAFTRYASYALIATFALGFIFLPPVFLAEHINFVGIAIFMLIVGRGPFSVDGLIGQHTRPHPNLVKYALPALRWGTGLSIIWLAFTEKLLNPEVASAFLTQSINFNLGSQFGVSDVLFVQLAGIVEFTMGVLLISGALPRLVILALWLPFNLTLPFLGAVELVGHLPVYATMLVLLVLNPSSHRASEAAARLLAEEANNPLPPFHVLGDGVEEEQLERLGQPNDSKYRRPSDSSPNDYVEVEARPKVSQLSTRDGNGREG